MSVRWLDVAEMVATPPPPVPWLAQGVIPRAALTMWWAPGGLGKSLLALSLATAIRHGEQLAGIECEEGITAYLDAENGEQEIHRRVHTLGLPTRGVDVGDAGGLDLRKDFDALQQIVDFDPPDFLVLDSLRALHPGMDENDTAQTAASLDRIRRLAHTTGLAILLIHHANKTGRAFRGASTIRDSVDVLWELGRVEGDPDRQRRYLHNSKMRVAQDGAKLWLRLAVDRGRVLIDEAEPFESEPTEPPAPVRTLLSTECLASLNGHPMRLAEIARAVGRGPKDGSVRNALAALAADGEVRKTREGLWERCKGAPPPKGSAPLHLVEATSSASVVEGSAGVDPFAGWCAFHGRVKNAEGVCSFCGTPA